MVVGVVVTTVVAGVGVGETVKIRVMQLLKRSAAGNKRIIFFIIFKIFYFLIRIR